jgi:hypothetical protein
VSSIGYGVAGAEATALAELEPVVENQHVDLIVVGTHGRTGLRNDAFSVAEAVFHMLVVLCSKRALARPRIGNQMLG